MSRRSADYVIDLLTPAQLEVLAEVGEAVGARLAAENCAAAGDEADCLVDGDGVVSRAVEPAAG